MASNFGVELLGKLPLDNQLMAACEEGKVRVTTYNYVSRRVTTCDYV